MTIIGSAIRNDLDVGVVPRGCTLPIPGWRDELVRAGSTPFPLPSHSAAGAVERVQINLLLA